MALYSIDGRRINDTPHEAEFAVWRSRLTAEQVGAIRAQLRDMIAGDEVHTAGWMPGNDWSDTVWEPIYTHACRYDMVASGLCFGLFVWEAIREHPDSWSFGRYEKDGIPIRSLTYFRIAIP